MATLSVPASLEQLANVNAFIHETIPSSYRPLIPQVELAAEELLVNVFSYAYPDVPGEAQVACREVRLDNVPYFCFKVQDWGAPFDPFLEAPVPDVSLGVDERPVGGLGIHLIKSVVAHYTYRISSNSISRCPSDPRPEFLPGGGDVRIRHGFGGRHPA